MPIATATPYPDLGQILQADATEQASIPTPAPTPIPLPAPIMGAVLGGTEGAFSAQYATAPYSVPDPYTSLPNDYIASAAGLTNLLVDVQVEVGVDGKYHVDEVNIGPDGTPDTWTDSQTAAIVDAFLPPDANDCASGCVSPDLAATFPAADFHEAGILTLAGQPAPPGTFYVTCDSPPGDISKCSLFVDNGY